MKKMADSNSLRRRVQTTSQVRTFAENLEQRQRRGNLRVRYWTRFLRNTGIFFLFVYLAIPVWFCLCPWLRRQCVFLHNFNWPPFQTTNLSMPKRWGIPSAQQFYVDSEPGITLGAWHIQPKSREGLKVGCHEDFDSDRPVILYLHGNSMNRAAAYRRAMYKVLTESEVDAHVVTFDYRGFGDSTYASPSVAGLVADGEAMYEWVKQRVDRSRIFIWGHSLGTGVTVQLVAKLDKENNPAGIVLESPFTNISDAARSFPLSILHRFMPFFDVFFSAPTRHTDTNFNSDEKVHLISTPILFLHAADDDMVAVELGRELHKLAQNRMASHQALQYVEFGSSHTYGHLNIHRAPELPQIFMQFMKSCQKPA